MSGAPGQGYGSARPVPMKLFSSWEVDRTPPNCIPRLCSMTLTRLVVTQPLLSSEASCLLIAVKMGGSRRTLRSNEIQLSPNGLIDTELELHFSLQYPHFLKRDENRMYIMLQRRKRYKNRAILGYKTLAEGTIDMALVLQRNIDIELNLCTPEGVSKDFSGSIAKVTIVNISSQPIDDIEGDRKSKQASAIGLRRQFSNSNNPSFNMNLNPSGILDPIGKATRALQSHDFSDDEDEFSSHSSDSPPDDVIIDPNSKSLPHNRNLKQRIVNLLRKFKATEEGSRIESKNCGPVGVGDIEELFDELEGLSDSEPDVDTLSVGSLPKPVLPPFFASSRSLIHHSVIPERSGGAEERGESGESGTDPEQMGGTESASQFNTRSPVTPIQYTPGLNVIGTTGTGSGGGDGGPGSSVTPSSSRSPKVSISLSSSSSVGPISDQLSRVLPPDDGFPELVAFVWMDPTLGSSSATLYNSLTKRGVKTLGITSEADLRVALPHLVGKVQKFCNNNAKAPPPLTILAIGPETLLSGISKTYVTQLSSKPHEWQSYFSFLFAPLTPGGQVWRLLTQSDTLYASVFSDYADRTDSDEFAARILSYAKAANDRRLIITIPIAEAMITYKENEESSQVFVPFISDVKLLSSLTFTSNSECSSGVGGEGGGGGQGQGTEMTLSSSPPSPPVSPRIEPLELQVDYWKGTVKSSIKAIFRTLSIQRTQDHALFVSYTLKEQKKQKIMRLGKKKERDSESKNLSMDGISRLVCLAKSQAPIKLFVDGIEWPGVKFFQVSSQWQSQVKTLPLLISNSGKGESSS